MVCTGQTGGQMQPSGFMKGRSGLTNLISICDRETGLECETEAVDVVCLVFSKAFDTVSHSIHPDKTSWSWLGLVCSLLGKNCLDCRAQGVIGNGVTTMWWPVMSGASHV